LIVNNLLLVITNISSKVIHHKAFAGLYPKVACLPKFSRLAVLCIPTLWKAPGRLHTTLQYYTKVTTQWGCMTVQASGDILKHFTITKISLSKHLIEKARSVLTSISQIHFLPIIYGSSVVVGA